MENGVGVVLLTMLLTQSLFLVVRVFTGMVFSNNVCFFLQRQKNIFFHLLKSNIQRFEKERKRKKSLYHAYGEKCKYITLAFKLGL